MIYKKNIKRSNHLKGCKEPFEGMCIEKEMEIATSSEQPITKASIAQCFYTQRKDGVLPECDIRTDTMELGQDGMTKANNEFKRRIQEKLNPQKDETKAE